MGRSKERELLVERLKASLCRHCCEPRGTPWPFERNPRQRGGGGRGGGGCQGFSAAAGGGTGSGGSGLVSGPKERCEGSLPGAKGHATDGHGRRRCSPNRTPVGRRGLGRRRLGLKDRRRRRRRRRRCRRSRCCCNRGGCGADVVRGVRVAGFDVCCDTPLEGPDLLKKQYMRI